MGSSHPNHARGGWPWLDVTRGQAGEGLSLRGGGGQRSRKRKFWSSGQNKGAQLAAAEEEPSEQGSREEGTGEGRSGGPEEGSVESRGTRRSAPRVERGGRGVIVTSNPTTPDWK
mmetsp:Transcript_30188/g.73986  ORF Transcript_30188/g.73986 Transcript_30188/m.73986 type:complete len:115 (-) Transcript_30188:309-653(-)